VNIKITPLLSCKSNGKTNTPKLKFGFAHHHFDSASRVRGNLEWKEGGVQVRAAPPCSYISTAGVEGVSTSGNFVVATKLSVRSMVSTLFDVLAGG